jgi:hypothetical protein
MYMGDDVSLGACCDDCAQHQGMSGIGLNPVTPTGITQDCTGLPILDFIKCEANKITTGILTRTVPVYSPPQFPTYPVNTQTPAAPAPSTQPTNWLPWALGGLAFVMLARRR